MDELSLQELSDEDLAKLVELGAIPEQQAALAKQMQQARMLQQQAGPEMRGNSRVQTAANPLEFLGTGLQQYAGMRQGKETQAKLDALQKQQMMGRQLYAQKAFDSPYRRESATVPMTADPSRLIPKMNF